MNTTEESKPMLISASRKQAGLPRANRTTQLSDNQLDNCLVTADVAGDQQEC